MKPLRFVGSALEDLAGFPEPARRAAGFELWQVQVGAEPSDFKPMASVGSGVYEIRIRDVAGAFRVMYVARFKLAIYVLHVFQKKTRKTPPLDLQLAATRYAKIKE